MDELKKQIEETNKKLDSLTADLEAEKKDKAKILQEKKDLLEMYNEKKAKEEDNKKKMEEYEKMKEDMTETEKALFDKNVALEKEMADFRDNFVKSQEAEVSKTIKNWVGADEGKQITLKTHLDSVSKLPEWANKDLDSRLDMALKLSGLEKTTNGANGSVSNEGGTSNHNNDGKPVNFTETERGKAMVKAVFPSITNDNNNGNNNQ